MRFNIPTGSEIVTRSMETLLRFPLAMLASFVVTVVSIYLVEMDYTSDIPMALTLSKVALSGSLALLVFTAVRLLGEGLSRLWHLLWTLLALLGVLGYYMILPDSSAGFGADMIPFRHLFLSLLFIMGILWAPFSRSSLSDADYWEYCKKIIFLLMITTLFAIMMILGINGALYVIGELFDFDIDGNRYFQIDIFIVGVFAVGYLLSQIPLHPLESKRSTAPSKIEKFFTKWMLTPLSGLYFVILYAYTAKVLMTLNWPKGILAWLIVAFSMVAILTYLFWTHYTTENHSRWRRWIWLAVLLQTVMLFVAIGMRIAEYSWTESRYMVFVLGVWLAGLSIYFLLFRNPHIKWIFISLSALIAITQFGPQSAYSLSRESQMDRLEGMLTELERYTDREKAPIALRYEVTDSIRYLYRRYKNNTLAVIFPKIHKEFESIEEKKRAHKETMRELNEQNLTIPKEVKKRDIELGKLTSYLPTFISRKLGFEPVARWEYLNPNYNNTTFSRFDGGIRTKGADINELIDIKGYDYMARFSMDGYMYVDGVRLPRAERVAFTTLDMYMLYDKEHILTITEEENGISIDIGQFLNTLIEKHGKKSKQLNRADLTLMAENNHTRVKLELDSIGENFYDGNRSVEFRGMFFIKELK